MSPEKVKMSRSGDFDFDVMGFEAVLVVYAVAERLVARTATPIVRLHYLSIDDDHVRSVFRGTDDNFRHKTLVSFRADKSLI